MAFDTFIPGIIITATVIILMPVVAAAATVISTTADQRRRHREELEQPMTEIVESVVLGIAAVSVAGATADCIASYFRRRRRRGELELRMRDAFWSQLTGPDDPT